MVTGNGNVIQTSQKVCGEIELKHMYKVYSKYSYKMHLMQKPVLDFKHFFSQNKCML